MISWPKNVNLFDYLIERNISEGRENKSAIIYKNHSISYLEVRRNCYLISHLLTIRNFAKKDRIVFLLPDTPAFVYTFFATIKIGGIVVPISPNNSAEDVQYIIDKVEPKVVLIDKSFEKKFSSLELSEADKLITGDFLTYFSALEQCLSGLSISKTQTVLEADLLAYCLFSSGTTGKQKGIPHRHSDILENIKAFSLPILNMCESDKVLAVPKLTFGYGLGGNLLSTFYVGGTTILFPEQTVASAIIEEMVRSSPTIFLAQPRILAGILNLNIDKNTFSSLRLITSAGEILSEALFKKWKEK